VSDEVNQEVVQLRDQVATLEQLLAKYQQETLEKSTKLEQALASVQEHAHQLELSEARYRKLARQKELLNRLVSQIRQSLDPDMILEAAVSELRWLLRLDSCIFWWYLPESSSFQAVYESYATDGLQHLSQKHYVINCTGDTGASVAAKSGKRSNSDSVAPGVSQVALPFPEARSLKDAFGVQSQLLMPTQTRSGRMGVIHCLQWQENRSWSAEEIELLQAVSSQLAIALDQADLYEQSCLATEQAQAQAYELEQALQEIQKTPQLIQTEKMASLGQLVAGVAHEINNPVNFIHGNLLYATQYLQDILDLLDLYQREYPTPTSTVQRKIDAIELEFIAEDLPKLLSSMKIGAERIREIVRSLRTFSRLDEAEVKAVNIHEGIESTLMILQNRLKPRTGKPAILMIKEYGFLPFVQCYAGQLNQVLMNILTNAIDAMEEAMSNGQWAKNNAQGEVPEGALAPCCRLPVITIRTDLVQANWIRINILDTGPGMEDEVQQRLFDPFFTTKPVGKGTGLGMSISYQIITETHGGQLRCHSIPGQGTEFVIEIPVQQDKSA
jgi:two-component system NtrC family sensor kinase